MSKHELDPTIDTMEAMHLAGQVELQFCMGALSTALMLNPNGMTADTVNEVLDKMLDRHNDLNIEPDESIEVV